MVRRLSAWALLFGHFACAKSHLMPGVSLCLVAQRQHEPVTHARCAWVLCPLCQVAAFSPCPTRCPQRWPPNGAYRPWLHAGAGVLPTRPSACHLAPQCLARTMRHAQHMHRQRRTLMHRQALSSAASFHVPRLSACRTKPLMNRQHWQAPCSCPAIQRWQSLGGLEAGPYPQARCAPAWR